MNYLEKLDYIFDLLLDENVYSKNGIDIRASYWKMGTDFFNMFDRLYDNIKDLDISIPIVSEYNPNNLTTEGKNKSYKLLMNNNNVTPCKVRGYVSPAAIHQYMRSILAFGIGVCETNYKNLKDFVIMKGKIILKHDAIRLLQSENRLFLIKKVIKDSFFSNIKWTRDIAYSIIMEFLLNKSFDFSLIKNRTFYWNKVQGKRNEKELKVASLIDDLNYIKRDIYRQGTEGTYKEIINVLESNYRNIEDFVNDIYQLYEVNNDDSRYAEIIDNQIRETNLRNQISISRSKFKNNIFEDRKNKGLIKDKNELYTDIVNLENNSTENLLSYFNEAEAAHIYDVWRIKDALIRNLDNTLDIKVIENPNNGIIMRNNYHKSFDRGQWGFNSNGEMVVPIENQKYLFETLGLQRIKIRNEIFNEEMRGFLNKRR